MLLHMFDLQENRVQILISSFYLIIILFVTRGTAAFGGVSFALRGSTAFDGVSAKKKIGATAAPHMVLKLLQGQEDYEYVLSFEI